MVAFETSLHIKVKDQAGMDKEFSKWLELEAPAFHEACSDGYEKNDGTYIPSGVLMLGRIFSLNLHELFKEDTIRYEDGFFNVTGAFEARFNFEIFIRKAINTALPFLDEDSTLFVSPDDTFFSLKIKNETPYFSTQEDTEPEHQKQDCNQNL